MHPQVALTKANQQATTTRALVMLGQPIIHRQVAVGLGQQMKRTVHSGTHFPRRIELLVNNRRNGLGVRCERISTMRLILIDTSYSHFSRGRTALQTLKRIIPLGFCKSRIIRRNDRVRHIATAFASQTLHDGFGATIPFAVPEERISRF